MTTRELARRHRVPESDMELWMQEFRDLGIVRRGRDRRWSLTEYGDQRFGPALRALAADEERLAA